MIGSSRNLLTYIAANPDTRNITDTFFQLEWKILVYCPLKDFDNTWTMTIQSNTNLSITFDFTKQFEKTVVNNIEFLLRKIYSVDEESVLVKKKRITLILENKAKQAVALFLEEILFLYMKDFNSILSGEKSPEQIKLKEKEVFLLCKEEFLNVAKQDIQLVIDLVHSTRKVFEIFPEIKPLYLQWIEEKNIPKHTMINKLKKRHALYRWLKKKFRKIRKRQ